MRPAHLHKENGIIGVEIKSRKVLAPSDFRLMKEVVSAIKGDWRGGPVVYRGNEIMKFSDPDIWAVPWQRLF